MLTGCRVSAQRNYSAQKGEAKNKMYHCCRKTIEDTARMLITREVKNMQAGNKAERAEGGRGAAQVGW